MACSRQNKQQLYWKKAGSRALLDMFAFLICKKEIEKIFPVFWWWQIRGDLWIEVYYFERPFEEYFPD